MAEAIGWPGKSLQWRDIFNTRARVPVARVSKPEWGIFKFGPY